MNKKRHINLSSTCTLSAGLIAVAMSSHGASHGLSLGQSRLHLFMSEGITQDDNVDQTADGSSDVYEQQSIGALWLRTTDLVYLQSTAWLSQLRYRQFAEKDCRNWGLSGTGRIASDKSFFSAKAWAKQQNNSNSSAAYDSVTDEIETTSSITFDQTDSSEARSLYNLLLTGGRQVSDLTSLQTSYSFYQVDYDETTTEGWHDQTLGSEISTKLTPSISSYITFQLSQQGGGGAPENGRGYTVRIGLKNTATTKTSIRLGLGMQHYTSDTEEYTEPSIDLKATWRATDKLLFSASCKNSVQPVGSDDLMELVFYGYLGASYQMSSTTSFTFSGSTLRKQYLDSTLVDGQLIQPVITKTTGTASLNYSPDTWLTIFIQAQLYEVQTDLAEDYDRFCGSIGIRLFY